MPEVKVPICGIDIMKWGGAIVALAIAWATIDVKVKAHIYRQDT